MDKKNKLFNDSKFSEIRLSKTKTNETFLENIKKKFNQKCIISKSNQDSEQWNKIEEKIEFCINESKKINNLSFIDYEKDHKDIEENVIENKHINNKKQSISNLDSRNFVEIMKYNSVEDLKKMDNIPFLSYEKIDAKNFSGQNFYRNQRKFLIESNKNNYNKDDNKAKINSDNYCRNDLLTSSSKKNSKKLKMRMVFNKKKQISLVEKTLNSKNSSIKKNTNLNSEESSLIPNLHSKLNSIHKSPDIIISDTIKSVMMLTEKTQLSTNENYGNKISNFISNADNYNINSNKTPIKNIDCKQISNDKNNLTLSQNKIKIDPLRDSTYNQNNKKSFDIIDFSNKKDYLNLKKSTDINLINSKLSNKKETKLTNFNKNISHKNKKIRYEKYEENFNSNINEHYFPEQTESEFLTYNNSISSEIDIKAITNRLSDFNYFDNRLNDPLNDENIKKSKSKVKMNVIRLPKKPLKKKQNLKIVVNPIYDFQNKNNFGTVNSKNQNIISPQTSNKIYKKIENPEKIKNEEANTNKINTNTTSNNNPFTATNASKKQSIAIYDFSNEEKLFSKKNKSHTPNNRGQSNNANNEIHTNITHSDKNKANFNFKKFNYVFGDGNSTTNKTSFFKSQTDLINKTDQINKININDKNNFIFNNLNQNKTSPKNFYSSQSILASSEMNNLIKKVKFDGDITNLKGRMKKN